MFYSKLNIIRSQTLLYVFVHGEKQKVAENAANKNTKGPQYYRIRGKIFTLASTVTVYLYWFCFSVLSLHVTDVIIYVNNTFIAHVIIVILNLISDFPVKKMFRFKRCWFFRKTFV